MPKYADVIVDITHEKLDRSFQYRVPASLEDSVREGSCVRIPFGRGDRMIEGYVVGLGTTPRFDPARTKELAGLQEDRLPVEGRLISLAAWMKETYGSTMIQALKTVLPVKGGKNEKIRRIVAAAADEAELHQCLEACRARHFSARERLLEAVLTHDSLEETVLRKEYRISGPTLKDALEAGWIRIEEKRTYRDPLGAAGEEQKTALQPLTDQQRSVCTGILQEWTEGRKRPCLLQGVTGSGKTRVYIELIRQMLQQGKQTIVLIPEIALTWQTVQRFTRAFGQGVTVLHSRMTPAERYDQMERARQGEVQIVVGPRSALFSPFPDLGLIIMDEEQEQSYQSEVTPRYHARETAEKRAVLEGAAFLMGSATPSMDAACACREGRYALFELKERIGNAGLPRAEVVDMRQELREGNRSIFSRSLQEKIHTCISRGEQAMVFLNRRGHTGFISCRSCGHVVKCIHCDISLTYHAPGSLVCHYCGYRREMLRKCPVCASPHIGGFRIGTQQVEEIAGKLFPEARILRMDADTTRGKQGHDRLLRAFADREADLLIGTQMIVKGHDFPGVTVVGALAADLSLYAGEYRAAERTYQLLVQAAGRAGRGDSPGVAVIQTYDPDNYCIQAAVKQDYDAFYEQEMGVRSLLHYPPAGHLLAVHGSCEKEEVLTRAMDYIRRFLLRIRRTEDTVLIGPAPESVAKIQDLHRGVIYVKGSRRAELVRMRTLLEKYIEMNTGFAPVNIQYDLNV